MATRSTIAIARDDGTVAKVYCHWDGYLDNNGRILIKHYTDTAKIEQLMAMGNLSSLGPEIGAQHEFSCPFEFGSSEYDQWQLDHDKVCTFYGRDRGEQDADAVVFEDIESYETTAQFEEYNYLFIGNRWYYKSYDGLVRDVEKQLMWEQLRGVAA